MPKSIKIPRKSRPAAEAGPKRLYQNAFALYGRQELEKSLKIDAKALGIAPGAAEVFIDKTLDAVEKNLAPRHTVSERDLTAAIAKELKKYHPDFAYIYQNRDKII